MPGPPLGDDEVYDRLHKALLALGRENGATTPGDSAIKTARRMLQLLELALVAAVEKARGEAGKPTDRPGSLPPASPAQQ